MLLERLQARCKSACFHAVARAEGFSVIFSKKSMDGSGKATLAPSENLASSAHGVVFTLSADELNALDEFEGRGKGYDRIDDFNVLVGPESVQTAVVTYIADSKSIDPSLKPYDWYLDLVVKGAIQNDFPLPYLQSLSATKAIQDPNPKRKTRTEALALLEVIAKSPA